MILKRTNLPSGHVVPHPQQSTSIFGVRPPLTKVGEKNWLRHPVNWTENFSSLEEIKRVDLQPIPIFGVWLPLTKAGEKIWSRHMVNWTPIFSSLEEIMGIDFSPIFSKNSVKFSFFFLAIFYNSNEPTETLPILSLKLIYRQCFDDFFQNFLIFLLVELLVENFAWRLINI